MLTQKLYQNLQTEIMKRLALKKNEKKFFLNALTTMLKIFT